MNPEINNYNKSQISTDIEICEFIAQIIDSELIGSESKIWHAHPVWFLDGNPIVGYSKQKKGIRLMFWSGADFDEENLGILGGNSKMHLSFTMTFQRLTR